MGHDKVFVVTYHAGNFEQPLNSSQACKQVESKLFYMHNAKTQDWEY